MLEGRIHEPCMRFWKSDVTGHGNNRPASLPDLGGGAFERIGTPCIEDESSPMCSEKTCCRQPDTR